MDKEMLEQFQLIIQGMGDMEKRLIQQIDAKIQESETRINLKIENEVSKRIESLFDGYKLVHEKQWELERQTEAMKTQIEELNARLAKLESKIAG
jgi:predicted  nucleic acid-binding Zn-ribbon protein